MHHSLALTLEGVLDFSFWNTSFQIPFYTTVKSTPVLSALQILSEDVAHMSCMNEAPRQDKT